MRTSPKKGFKRSPEFEKRVQTPIFRQLIATECGAACLGSVLGYFGLWISLTELREKCQVSRDGSSAAGVLRAARNYGLECRGLAVDAKLLKKLKPPLILFWQFSHFVVFEGFDGLYYYLNDPATGKRRLDENEFFKGYSGIALEFDTGKDFLPSGKKTSLWSKVRNTLSGSEKEIITVGAITFILASLLLIIPGTLFLSIQNGFPSHNNWFLLFLLLICGGVITYGLSILKQRILQGFAIKISLQGFDFSLSKLLRLPILYFAQRTPGEITERVTANDRVGQNIAGHYFSILSDILYVVILVTAMIFLQIELALVVVLLVMVQGAIVNFLNYNSKTLRETLLHNQGVLVGAGLQLQSHAENLRMTGMDDHFFLQWSGQQAQELYTRKKLISQQSLKEALPHLFASIRIAAIVLVGGNYLITGEISIGLLVAFFFLSEISTVHIQRVFSYTEKQQEIENDYNRIEDITKSSDDPRFLHQEKETDSIVTFMGRLQIAGRLELKDVSFGFNTSKPALIKNFNLIVEPGQRVAIVGPSGSGKSTIARLVSGIIQPWVGEILFDGYPRTDIPEEVMRRSLSMVSQDIALFQGTIRDNITLWNPEIPDEVIINAARDASIHNDIIKRPYGYSTLVEKGGSNFSGGQRQRLEIARALVGNPVLLVLDEATSTLDAVTEDAVDEALRRRGISCLIIAHRLSTIRDCDLIVVLDKGMEVQRGTHEELIQDQEGIYFNLVATA